MNAPYGRLRRPGSLQLIRRYGKTRPMRQVMHPLRRNTYQPIRLAGGVNRPKRHKTKLALGAGQFPRKWERINRHRQVYPILHHFFTFLSTTLAFAAANFLMFCFSSRCDLFEIP
jgi:hypothetical protein